MRNLIVFILIFQLVVLPFPNKTHAATDIVNDATLSTSLQGCWSMDETSGTRVDSTANNNDLTDNNTVLSTTTAKFGNAAEFQLANSEYLSITDASQTGLDFSGDFSASFWMTIDTLPASNVQMGIFNKWLDPSDRAYSFSYWNQAGVLKWLMQTSDLGNNNGFGTINQTLSADTTYHIVVTVDASAGSFEVFVDNTSAGTGTGLKTSYFNGAAVFQIGTVTNTLQYYDGIYDEFAVWSKIVSSGEISSLYASGTGIPCDAGGETAVTPTSAIHSNTAIFGNSTIQ